MRYILKYILIIIPTLLFGQENISLKESIQIGLKQNYDILISKKQRDINNINNNWANAGALPQVNINTALERNISDQSNNPTSFIQEILKSDAISSSANINWTLFNGFAIQANKERLNQLEKLSEGNLTLVIENTIQTIILSYYNCILQQEKLNLLEDIVALSKERFLYEQTKNKIGISNILEFLQIENSLLTDSANLIMQKLNLSNAIKNFNLIIGVELEKKWNFISELNHEIQLYDYHSLLNKTFAKNSNILNQYINIEIAKQEMQLSKSNFYPSLSLNSGAIYNQNNYDLGDYEYNGSSTGRSLNYFTNLTLSLRLFDGGKLYSKIKHHKKQIEKNEIELEKIKKNIANDLSKKLAEYDSQIQIYNINKRAFEISETNYKLAIEKHKIGSINSFDLRDVEISYINSGISFLQSSYNLIDSKISLSKITGGIIQEH